MPRYRHLGCLAALFLAASAFVDAQSYTWSTFAGLPPQFGFADGPASSSRFFLPAAAIASASGVIYVCDSGNATIRRIAPNGAVTTLAGSAGRFGSADGQGVAARFGYPTGITLANGFLYVVDKVNHTIRRIDGSGNVLTFAGRAGVAGSADGNTVNARFNEPSQIASDESGNLYVSDSGNHVIRKITPTGEVSTFAGVSGIPGSIDGPATSARFNRPQGIDAIGGVVFVADTYNHTIRRIENGMVTTLAGSPGQTGSANGTGSAALFRYPVAVLAFTGGTLLVTDESHAVRRVSTTGVVTTYAGQRGVPGSQNGTYSDARFYYPSGLTFVPGGIAVADTLNHSIRILSSSANQVSIIAGPTGNFGRRDGVGTQPATAALLDSPTGIATHSSGDVYLADSGSATIRKITPTGQVTRVAGAASGEEYRDGAADNHSLNYPVGVAVAADRTIYFSEQAMHTIRVVKPDGSVSTLAGRQGVAGSSNGAGSAALFTFPSEVALDKQGNLYIADMGNHAIRKIAAGSSTVTTFAGLAGVPGSADGTTSARFSLPRGIAVDANDNILVADTGNHTIRRISPSGEVSTIAGAARVAGSANGIGTSARFFSPISIGVGAQDAIYVADYGNNLIRQIVGETVSTIGGVPGALGYRDELDQLSLFSTPSGVAIDRNGVVYVADAGNNLVRRGERYTKPAITAAPGDLIVLAGGSTTLSVTATGGMLSYQWYFNGTAIPGATGPTYTIQNATPAATGNYSVTVINALGVATSPNTQVSVVTLYQGGRITNLSILTSVERPGDNFTMGFVIGGAGTNGTKPLVIRAAGPSLAALGVPGTLDDPKLELFFGPSKTGENDNWGGSPALASAMDGVGAFGYQSPTSLDAAAAANFTPGNNSVKISAAGSGTGQVIAEIYDASPTNAFTTTTPRLVNVSVLKDLGSGLTAGFAITGNSAKTVLIRVIGPTLGQAPFNVAGVIADPRLTLFSGSSPIGANDNWGGGAALSAAFEKVGAFSLPSGSADAALLATLQPGTYTVQVSAGTGASGVGLVEIYDVP